MQVHHSIPRNVALYFIQKQDIIIYINHLKKYYNL
jgi:hypothetical protein